MLYRKYRPKKFSDITGQIHVVQTLQGAIGTDSVGHAYLFCGPRGTGKTTMARLLAKATNCEKRAVDEIEPCNSCGSCNDINTGSSMDLIEIDAASNRGIDEIRNIKESATVASTSSKYKIFIIDEVHMLTTAAFNALLKTLEEPPSHVKFLLATTEAHKVLDTILSRVQRLDFKKLTVEEIQSRLSKLAKKENVSIDQQSLAMLANYSSGSIRDGESAMAKLMAYSGKKITQDDTTQILGIVPSTTHALLLSTLLENRPKEAIEIINTIYDSGVSTENFSRQFISHIRNELVSHINSAGDSDQSKKLIQIINSFISAQNDLRSSPIPTLPLELAVISSTSQKI